MAPHDKPVEHPAPQRVWRFAFAVASIYIVGFGAAVMATIWFVLH
jgi:hypothetical protein